MGWFLPERNQWLVVDFAPALVSRLMREPVNAGKSNDFSVLVEGRHRTLHWYRLEFINDWWIMRRSCMDAADCDIRMKTVENRHCRGRRRTVESIRIVPVENPYAALAGEETTSPRSSGAPDAPTRTTTPTRATAPPHTTTPPRTSAPRPPPGFEHRRPKQVNRLSPAEYKEQQRVERQYAPPPPTCYALEWVPPAYSSHAPPKMLRDPGLSRSAGIVVSVNKLHKIAQLFGMCIAQSIMDHIDSSC